MEMNREWQELEELMNTDPAARAMAMNLSREDMQALERLRSMEPFTQERYRDGDIGNSNLYADFFFPVQRYVAQRKHWYWYDGRVWQFDYGSSNAHENAKQLVRLLRLLVREIDQPDLQASAAKRVMKMCIFGKRLHMLDDARSVSPVQMEDFDRDPWLFNCLNGTLDLRTGQLRPHSAEDLITRLAPVAYDPLAVCPRWDQFVDQVMAVPENVQQVMGETDASAQKSRYLQKAMGYALTGDASRECMFVLYGKTTRNGKSTLLETVGRMMGDYARTARPETFTSRPSSGSAPNEDVARLRGARLVSVAEPELGFRLSASLIKRCTGNDTLTARYLHESSFQFLPEFKIFMNTNHLPMVTDQTLLTSGRVKIIPFERHFRPEEQDRELKSYFAAQRSAVLNWCLEGLRLLQEEGLDEPECMKLLEKEHREDCDWLEQFMSDCLVESPGYRTKASEVYVRYREWCVNNGFEILNSMAFRRVLRERVTIKKARPTGGGSATDIIPDLEILRTA